MIAVRVMQPSVHQVVDVVAVRHGFVSAARTMLVRASNFGRTAHGVGVADVDGMLVDVIVVHVVQMAVMKVVDMVAMAHGRMPAVRTMLMGVVGMVLLGAGGHDVFSLFVASSRGSPCYCRSAACSIALCTNCSNVIVRKGV
jgi:hypothetical protein